MEAPRWKSKHRSKTEVDNPESRLGYIDCSSIQPKHIWYISSSFSPYWVFIIIDVNEHHTDQNGSYMVNSEVNNGEAADYALDLRNAEKLWKLSEDLVGQEFSY